MIKTACLIFNSTELYDSLASCAIKSFQQFHQDIDLYTINYNNAHLYGMNHINPLYSGPIKYAIAYKIMKEKKYDKMILLGADTITCSRLYEFLEVNDHQVITSLDYPYQLLLSFDNDIISTPILYRKSSEKEKLIFGFEKADILPYPEYEIIEHSHINADVVCFNDVEVLGKVVRNTSLESPLKEQAALNYTLYHTYPPIKSLIVDYPYCLTKVLYNVRSKGNISGKSGVDPHYEKYIQQYKIINNFLYTYDYKLIRIYHYCESFGSYNTKEEFEEIVKFNVKKNFNIDTINFFCNNCNCEDFFIKYYFDGKS